MTFYPWEETTLSMRHDRASHAPTQKNPHDRGKHAGGLARRKCTLRSAQTASIKASPVNLQKPPKAAHLMRLQSTHSRARAASRAPRTARGRKSPTRALYSNRQRSQRIGAPRPFPPPSAGRTQFITPRVWIALYPRVFSHHQYPEVRFSAPCSRRLRTQELL